MRLPEEIAPQANPVPRVPYPLGLLSRRRTPPPAAGVPRPPGEGSEKEPFVLIVEDEKDTSDALTELLEDEGFKSAQARHGGEALELLRAGARPALILLDIKMPVMDGNEFLRRISFDPELAEIPIAIVTASATPPDVSFRKRDAGFFRKPVDYERLLETIRFYCG